MKAPKPTASITQPLYVMKSSLAVPIRVAKCVEHSTDSHYEERVENLHAVECGLDEMSGLLFRCERTPWRKE